MHTANPLTHPESHPSTIEHPIAATILLAGATGARGMLGVAAMSRALAHQRRAATQPARAFTGPRARITTSAFAAMELVGDKIPGIQNRVDAGPLVGRALAGAFIGAVIGGVAGRNRVTSALVGAASAVVGAHLTFRLRKRLMSAMPSVPAAMLEDAIVMGIASAGVATLNQGR